MTSLLSISQHDVDVAATTSSCKKGTMVAHVRILVMASTLSFYKVKCLGCARQVLANAGQGQTGNVDDGCSMQYHCLVFGRAHTQAAPAPRHQTVAPSTKTMTMASLTRVV